MNYSTNDQLLIWLCPSILKGYTWAAHMLAVGQLSDNFKTASAVKVKSNTIVGAFVLLVSGKGSYREVGPWSGIRDEGIDWQLGLGPFHLSQPLLVSVRY